MRWKRSVALVVLVIGVALAAPVERHARAAALLLRFTGAEPQGFARYGMRDVVEEAATVQTRHGAMRARFYVPVGVRDPPGVLVCHGVHHLGIEEPRMIKFARAIASSGVLVLTPELKEITDYRIEPSTVDTIGRAALDLGARVKRTGVGVLGLSFAGGLALLAAASPEYARAIDFVVAVGAHDDLERVARFFVTDEIGRPDGTLLHLHAHDYGAVVLVHMYAAELFSRDDLVAAREALRLWLWEQFDDARAAAKRLSPAGQAQMALVFEHKEAELRPALERVIAAHHADMVRVSPSSAIAGVRAKLFLLHGEGDTVIPPSETLWLAHDAPEGAVASAVVSRAILHVNLEGEPTWRERYDLVHLLAGVLSAAEDEAPSGGG